jgi:hypothetical protein
MKGFLRAAAAALLLSACTAAQGVTKAVVTEAMADPEKAQFIMTDLVEANRSAHEYDDVLAYTCYDFLEMRLPELGIGKRTTVVGAISAFQKTRNGVKMTQEGFSPEFLQACGPLYLDARKDVRGIISFLASLGAGGAL